MVWVGAFTILGILVGIRFWEREFAGFSSVVFVTILGFLIGVIIGCLMTPHNTETVRREYGLASLRDSGVTGTFFLGTGSLEDGAYYRYYMETGNGYQLKTLRSENNNVSVFEENRKDAVLRITYRHLDYLRNENTMWTLRQADEWQPLGYEFHVPYGTIHSVFSLR